VTKLLLDQPEILAQRESRQSAHWVQPSTQVVVEKKSIPTEGLILPDRGPEYLSTFLWIEVPTVLVCVFAFFELIAIGNPFWVPWLPLILGPPGGLLLVYVAVSAALNDGIALSDEGMVYYYVAIRPSRAVRRCVPWSELKVPILGPRTISFDTPGTGMGLTFEQALMVLTDPRYPWRETVPPEIMRKIERKPTTLGRS
jgi:hypothetical protein